MARTIVISGYGIGISDAVARRFGREGFDVALVEQLATAAERLGGTTVHSQTTEGVAIPPTSLTVGGACALVLEPQGGHVGLRER